MYLMIIFVIIVSINFTGKSALDFEKVSVKAGILNPPRCAQ